MPSRDRQKALEHSRQGDVQAWGELLESFRPYIRVIVRGLKDQRLQGRVDESDLIQDVMVAAHRGFPSFRGGTVGELVVWLRQIVVRSTADTVRAFVDTDKRDPGREEPIGNVGDLAGEASTPSAQAIRHEQAELIAYALTRLPDDMQQALLGRHVEGLTHAAIAQRLGRTEAAVRVLYVRALDRLRELTAEKK